MQSFIPSFSFFSNPESSLVILSCYVQLESHFSQFAGPLILFAPSHAVAPTDIFLLHESSHTASFKAFELDLKPHHNVQAVCLQRTPRL